ncbi:sugar ABC transporter substrate-binding protein [Umezawaea beigongshangensis]|uniref:sugar ABC transporter substrate-binding protein n=1 Tax=Umezawaea beigongshangensis TaxID=2780383 RepID=UPI0018F25657|nr:extracellular solute-binding protein [Umezawaea beigongshangensis]
MKLSFTDAAGVRWLRNQYGRLTELAPELHIKTDFEGVTALSRFEDEFLAAYGVTVTFETKNGYYPQERFVTDVREEGRADALVCPHDWLGDLIERDVIEPTILTSAHQSAFPAWVLSALTVDGELYGLPSNVDTVALIRNTRLAPEPPRTFEELVSTGEELRRSGLVTHALALRTGEQGDPFQIWPLFESAGGRLFGRTPDGRWDPTSVRLAEPRSVAAFERLRTLGEAGAGFLRRSVGRTEAIELFTSERCPYLVTTSDALKQVRAAGLPVAVSAVPPFDDGEPASGLTLVRGLVMMKAVWRVVERAELSVVAGAGAGATAARAAAEVSALFD